jgi:DNA repair protein RadC
MENTISEIRISYSSVQQNKIGVKNSEDSYKLFLSSWSKDLIELQEEFKVLLLNRCNKVLGIYNCSKGGVSGTIVDAKLVFVVGIKSSASSIIVAHNHPSGNLKPSEADIRLTKKLKEAGEFLDIKVLDHLIISKEGFFSFADEGIM